MKHKSVVAILVDGARADVLERMALAGELPNLKKHFYDVGGGGAATSVFPTVSGPAHLPLLAGAHPGRANLPGIRWAERPTSGRGRFLGRTRSYMAPLRAFKLERDVPADLTTLFHHVDHMADVNTWFVRGCPPEARFTRFSKAAAFFRSLVTRNWSAAGDQAEAALLHALERGFRSAFVVFPTIDELGHRFGPLADETLNAYRIADAAVGRVMDALTRQHRLRETLVMITSDHGQTATHTHVDIDEVVRRVYPRTVCYPEIWRHMLSAEAAVMVSGNSIANVYVQGRDGWHERPELDEPGSRAFELRERLLEHPAVAHVIHRGVAPDTYVIAGPRGRMDITTHTRQAPASSPVLEVTVKGEDPLRYPALPDMMDAARVAELTADTDYPDAPWQVVNFFRSARAGDLVVCARPGFDLRARFEYQPHNGSHGALDRDHMMVPALVNARWAKPRMRAVDLFPSILAALGRPVPENIDGESVIVEA